MNSGRINFRDRKPIDKTPADDSDENLIDTSYEKNKEAFDELNEGHKPGVHFLLGVCFIVASIVSFMLLVYGSIKIFIQ